MSKLKDDCSSSVFTQLAIKTRCTCMATKEMFSPWRVMQYRAIVSLILHLKKKTLLFLDVMKISEACQGKRPLFNEANVVINTAIFLHYPSTQRQLILTALCANGMRCIAESLNRCPPRSFFYPFVIQQATTYCCKSTYMKMVGL